MSERAFLDLTGRMKADAISANKGKKNASVPISKNNLIYDFETKPNQVSSPDDKSVKKAIDDAKNSQENELICDDKKGFNPNDILDEYEITKDDLKYATGEQLAGLYFEAQYSDDANYLEHNSMLITLLSGATTEQIEDFMQTIKEATRNDDVWENNYNFTYDNLGKQLLYASKAKKITGKEQFDEFMETVANNPDLFPNYNEYVGISFGNQL